MDDFNTMEQELRDIDNDFVSGQMNALGSAATQEALIRELRRIAEVETNVFYKTCAILKGGNADEHSMLMNMFASAQPPPQASATGRQQAGSGTAGDGQPLSAERPIFQGTSVSAPSLGSSVLASQFPAASGVSGDSSKRASVAQQRGSVDSPSGMTTAPHIKPVEWRNENGFPDRVFDDVANRFHMLESEFASLGDSLRQISQHVVQINDMSEQVNRAATAGGASGVYAPAMANSAAYGPMVASTVYYGQSTTRR